MHPQQSRKHLHGGLALSLQLGGEKGVSACNGFYPSAPIITR